MRLEAIVLVFIFLTPAVGMVSSHEGGEVARSSGEMEYRGIDGLYHSFPEVESELQALAASHPGIVKLVSIGKTYEGRDIWAVKISDNPGVEEDEPEVYFNGGHHAREWMGPEVSMCIINSLVENYTTNATIADIVDNRQVWVVPVVNPDGRVFDGGNDPATYANWRKNRTPNGDGTYGIDLNRNYDYMWGGAGASDLTSDDGFRGPYPFSENETAAVRDFASQHDFRFSISYHSTSQLILYPWGYTRNHTDDNALFSAVAQEMSNRITNTADSNRPYYQPEQGSELYPTSGSDDDWLYGELGVYSFVIELYPHWSDFFPLPDPAISDPYNGFHPREDKIIPVCNDNLPAALYLAQIADNPFQVIRHVSLSAPVTEMGLNQSEPGAFTIDVLNDGNSSDTFDLTVSAPPGWSADIVPGSTSLDRTLSSSSVLNVVPPPAAEGEFTLLVNATSTNDSTVMDSLELRVVVPRFDDVGVEGISPFVRDGDYPLGNYTITSTVKNHGINEQTFDTSLEIYRLSGTDVRTLTYEDAEDGVTDWTVEDLDGPYSPTSWHMTTWASNTGLRSWALSNTTSPQYASDTVQLLVSPPLDLREATGANLSFYHMYFTEASYDFCSLDILNGTHWETPVTFSGTQLTFAVYGIDLKDYIGQDGVRIRFRFTSDSATEDQGWFVDDIEVTAEFYAETLIYGPVNRSSVQIATGSSNTLLWNYRFTQAGKYKVVSRTWLASDSEPDNDRVGVRINVNDLKFRVNLARGLNLISTPMVLSDTSVANFFAQLAGKYDIVWYYDALLPGDPWRSYNPAKGANDLSDVNNTMGIWVNATEDSYLDLDIAWPAGTNIDLRPGWNLIGYPSMTDRTVADIFSSVVYERIEGFDLGAPARLRLLGDQDWLSPGCGYWVKVGAAQSLFVAP